MTQSISTLLIFGASGDLSGRLLLPALGQLLTREPERRVTLIGTGAESYTEAEWVDRVRQSFATVDASGPAVDAVLGTTSYQTSDVTKPADLQRLLQACTGAPAIYFALPPAVAALACTSLAQLTLPEGTELCLEKPFGTDEASAEALNAQLATLVPERQIHRVDHFLGRSTVYNFLGVRFANRIFEPIWNNQNVAGIDIIYDEELALEGRARYYDRAGALVDMIQSHLLQVLAVLTMEPPSTLNADDLRDAKALALRATRVWKGDGAAASRRARYGAGSVDGRDLPAYVDEDGVDPARQTETLAEVTLEVNTWRWSGVPFTVRSGKALGERKREVVVTFKPASLLPGGFLGAEEPAQLRLMLAPDAMSLELNINGPGNPFQLERTALSVEFGEGQLLAYGEVLAGILDNDASLSVRGDTAVDCWRIVAPVVQAWRDGAVELETYPAGSRGPADWAPLG